MHCTHRPVTAVLELFIIYLLPYLLLSPYCHSYSLSLVKPAGCATLNVSLFRLHSAVWLSIMSDEKRSLYNNRADNNG